MKRYQTAVSRRAFMKAMGSAAACAPVMTLLKSSITEAAPPVAPLRLIMVSSPYHPAEALWHPQNGSGGLATGSNFTLSFPNAILAPFASYQSKLMVLRGLNYQSPANNAPSGHNSAAAQWTGGLCDFSGAWPTTNAKSIEHYLSGRMKANGQFQPLTLGVCPYAYSQDQPVSWSGGGAGIHANGNPANVFQTLFGNFQGGGTTAAQQTMTRRQSMLSFMQSDLNSLMSRLAGPEQQKLQQHAATLSNLQAQFAAAGAGGSSCSPPAAPQANTTPWNFPQMQTDSNNFATLIVEAFACDLTRFAGLTFLFPCQDPAAVAGMPGLTNFASVSSDFHAYTHATTSQASNPVDIRMSQFHTYWSTQIAALMGKLAAIDDPLSPGQKLLDNTLIVWTMEHGITRTNSNDSHQYVDAPIILAGGVGGMFTMGRIFEATPRVNGGYAGVPHNALLAAIVNAFEVNQQRYNAAYTPLILNQYGDFAATPLSL